MSILAQLSFLRHREPRKRVAAIALVAFVLSGGYAVLAPSWYRSVLSVLPTKPQRAGISSMLGGEMAGLASSFEGPLGGAADVARIAAVLQSLTVTDAVIEKFDLKTRYREKYQELAREELWRHCGVKAMPKPNLVQLSCEDKDPEFVQEMLAFFAEHGNTVFRRVSATSASEEVRFLERRVAELRQNADAVAAEMQAFQERHKIVDLDSQAKAVVSALATLNGHRIAKQLELDYARTFASGDEATTRQLRNQLSAVGETLRELELPRAPDAAERGAPGSAGRTDATNVFPAALDVPRLRAEFERLYRDRKVAEATLVFALDRLEGARAAEARDVSTFVVLDSPVVPTRHSRPQRLKLLVVSVLLALGAAVGREWWTANGRRAANPVPSVPPRLEVEGRSAGRAQVG